MFMKDKQQHVFEKQITETNIYVVQQKLYFEEQLSTLSVRVLLFYPYYPRFLLFLN